MKRTTFWTTCVVFVLVLWSILFLTSIANYSYEKKLGSYWDLAEKASSLEQKEKYIDKFVVALEASGLLGQHNAIFFKTDNNSFDRNLEALKSLQKRLKEIKGMKVESFEYNTAIQQITGQEQKEAQEMISVFRGVYIKENFILVWDWVGLIAILIYIISLLSFCGWIMYQNFKDL